MKPGDLVTTCRHGDTRQEVFSYYFIAYADLHELSREKSYFTLEEKTLGIVIDLAADCRKTYARVLFPQGVGWINTICLEAHE